MFNKLNVPKVGDAIILEGVKKTVFEIAKNVTNDPVVCWTSKQEEGGCMLAIWNEWAHYAKLGKPLPRTRRSDMYDYLEANKEYLEIVINRRFYAGCTCECCSTKKRPEPDLKCSCGIH